MRLFNFSKTDKWRRIIFLHYFSGDKVYSKMFSLSLNRKLELVAEYK